MIVISWRMAEDIARDNELNEIVKVRCLNLDDSRESSQRLFPRIFFLARPLS